MNTMIIVYPFDQENTDINYDEIERVWCRICMAEDYILSLAQIPKNEKNSEKIVRRLVNVIKDAFAQSDVVHIMYFTDFSDETDDIIYEIIEQSGIQSKDFGERVAKKFSDDLSNVWDVLTGFKRRYTS